jgi:DNA end-binding protein Ku
VVPASAQKAPGGRALEKKEVQMAKHLVEALEGEPDQATYTDEYRDRVLELVEAKAAGQVVKFPKAPRRKKEEDLSDMLEKSVKAARKASA